MNIINYRRANALLKQKGKFPGFDLVSYQLLKNLAPALKL